MRHSTSECALPEGLDASQRLATLAYQFRHDAFTHEKLSIDHIIAVLSEDKGYDIKHRDFCTEEFNRNQLQTEEKHTTTEGGRV